MLHDLLATARARDPQRPMLEHGGQTWTCEQLEETARRLALGLLAARLEPMDRVAVLLPNRPETVIAYLACFKAALVNVPLDYRHHAVQIGYAMHHSAARAIIVHQERLAELEEENLLGSDLLVLVVGDHPPERLPAGKHYRPLEAMLTAEISGTLPTHFPDDDLCVMIYTSGTTSRPKGVTYTRSAMVEGIKKYLPRFPLQADDVALVAAPITRPMALRSQLLPMLRVGGLTVLLEGFNPDSYIDALARPPAKTFLALLPSAVQSLLRHPRLGECDFSRLRICMSGGDHVPISLHAEFHRATGVELTEQYGSSETAAVCNNPPFGRKKPGSCGLPMYAAQVCIVDDQGEDVAAGATGQIIVKSPMTMDGYWNDTALTRKVIRQGWVLTGDIGRFDEDGYLWFVGRKRDVIIRGGSNISPLEVENALLEHPGVAQACAVGVTSDEHGQEVVVFVVPAVGASVDEATLVTFATSRLAEYMVPSQFYVIESLPYKGAGKIDRDRLRLRAEAGEPDL